MGGETQLVCRLPCGLGSGSLGITEVHQGNMRAVVVAASNFAVLFAVPPIRLVASFVFTSRFRPYSAGRTLGVSEPRKMSSASSPPPSAAPSEDNKADVIQNYDDSSGSAGNDVIVQYVVLRRDLIETWPMGSVVTQGCHASVAAIWSHKDDPYTLQYCCPRSIDSMHKVTLEVKGETQILNLSEMLNAAGIDHKLWIEQPENFPTCLATKPYPKSVVSSFFKRLKLCK